MFYFLFQTSFPVPYAMHCAELLRRAPASNQSRSDAYFVGGRAEHAAVQEPEAVDFRALTWMETNQLGGPVGAAPHQILPRLIDHSTENDVCTQYANKNLVRFIKSYNRLLEWREKIFTTYWSIFVSMSKKFLKYLNQYYIQTVKSNHMCLFYAG